MPRPSSTATPDRALIDYLARRPFIGIQHNLQRSLENIATSRAWALAVGNPSGPAHLFLHVKVYWDDPEISLNCSIFGFMGIPNNAFDNWFMHVNIKVN
jgi:hypothetical protein